MTIHINEININNQVIAFLRPVKHAIVLHSGTQLVTSVFYHWPCFHLLIRHCGHYHFQTSRHDYQYDDSVITTALSLPRHNKLYLTNLPFSTNTITTQALADQDAKLPQAVF